MVFLVNVRMMLCYWGEKNELTVTQQDHPNIVRNTDTTAQPPPYATRRNSWAAVRLNFSEAYSWVMTSSFLPG